MKASFPYIGFSVTGRSVHFAAKRAMSPECRAPVSRLGLVSACSALIFCAPLLTPAAYPFGDDCGVVAVYSAVSPAYTRTVLPGGSFQPETYVFGKGGSQGGGMNDFTVDNLHFLDVARRIAPALAEKNYQPGKDPRQTNLLIMVYWGTTSGTNGGLSSSLYQSAQSIALQSMPQSLMLIQMANRIRDQQDLENAKLLGYLPEMIRLNDYKHTYFNRLFRQDVVDEVEESRYYVVLLAYDFQTLWKSKQRKMLWETRFSIREHRNDFSEALAAMAQHASRYFGQDSKGLIRERLPEARITLGEPKVLEYEPEKK
jgi:hypothetical protein